MTSKSTPDSLEGSQLNVEQVRNNSRLLSHKHLWTSSKQHLDKLRTSSKQVMNKLQTIWWKSYEQVVNKSWTSHEKIMNQSSKQIMNKKQHMNKSWMSIQQSWSSYEQVVIRNSLTSHTQDMIKSWISHQEIMNKSWTGCK